MSIEEILLTKYDLEEKLDESLRHETLFNIRLWNHQKENEDERFQSDMICSRVSLWLRESRTSFVSPAYFYNEFIDSLVKDVWWDDIKYSIDENERESSTLREHKKNLLFQNCLVSIKMGLDRYVSLLSNYYKGVSRHSTFGHITTTENGIEKAKGLMVSCTIKTVLLAMIFYGMKYMIAEFPGQAMWQSGKENIWLWILQTGAERCQGTVLLSLVLKLKVAKHLTGGA